MSVIPELSWWQRRIVSHGLHEPDQLDPPPGYSSWEVWFAFQGYDAMTDFLPLGPDLAGNAEGARLSVVWTRDGEDIASTGMHFVHAVDDDTVPFTGDDCATIEGLYDFAWDNLKDFYDANIALDRYVWHNFGVGVRSPNPERRTVVKAPAIPGTNEGSQLPPAVAIAVTFKTDKRRSWGRSYLPAVSIEALGEHGNITDDVVDSIRTTYGTLADDCVAADLPLVVWCPRRDGNLLEFYSGEPPRPEDYVLDLPDVTSVARGVVQIQVDNLYDTIRSRRNATASHKATHTLG